MLSLKQRREKQDANQAIVKYFLGKAEIDLGEGGNFIDAMLRKALKAEGKKMQRRFGHLVHPETGERPDIHLVIEQEGKTKINVVLVTDSPVLRNWLKEKGIVISEVETGAPDGEESVNPEIAVDREAQSSPVTDNSEVASS